MLKILRPIIIIIAVLLVIVIALFIAHEAIEARVFRELAGQHGISITIGSRNGNLLAGYDLIDVEVRQTTGQGDTPPGVFRTSRLSIHWKLRPFSISEISWDEGSYAFITGDDVDEIIPVGAGTLLPDDTGWLVGDAFDIGPDQWDGTMTLKIRRDGKEVDGAIIVNHLPSRYIDIAGTAPEDFRLPPEVVVAINLAGVPGNITASGSVSDPYTRRSFRF